MTTTLGRFGIARGNRCAQFTALYPLSLSAGCWDACADCESRPGGMPSAGSNVVSNRPGLVPSCPMGTLRMHHDFTCRSRTGEGVAVAGGRSAFVGGLPYRRIFRRFESLIKYSLESSRANTVKSMSEFTKRGSTACPDLPLRRSPKRHYSTSELTESFASPLTSRSSVRDTISGHFWHVDHCHIARLLGEENSPNGDPANARFSCDCV